jgi:3-dehydroquinate synthetase
MVDSSLGGKTGADLPQGKNLVGAFHPPALVLSDPNTLATLPADELRSGIAEVVKHGVISDPQLFSLCAAGWPTIEKDWSRLISQAVAVKANIIQRDPYERGERAALNLGHTIGHAVEAVSGFKVKHGEGVAIGMVAEARLSEWTGLAEKGLAKQIAGVVVGLGLPTQIPGDLNRDDILKVMRFDKKRAQRKVRFALPVRIGQVQVGIEIPNIQSLLLEL